MHVHFLPGSHGNYEILFFKNKIHYRACFAADSVIETLWVFEMKMKQKTKTKKSSSVTPSKPKKIAPMTPEKTKRATPETPAKTNSHSAFCDFCNKRHDWRKKEYMECKPPLSVLCFGKYRIDPVYRLALYEHASFYNTEEVVGSFLGHNPYFPSQEEWMEQQNEESSDQGHEFSDED